MIYLAIFGVPMTNPFAGRNRRALPLFALCNRMKATVRTWRRPAARSKTRNRGRNAMTAYNIVRMRVKPGREKDYLDLHKKFDNKSLKGSRRFTVVKTGDRTYCIIGEWDSMDAIVAARPGMIGILDGFRDMLEDLGGGLGVTDPVSGEAVVEIK
jgi:hypothetical protein